MAVRAGFIVAGLLVIVLAGIAGAFLYKHASVVDVVDSSLGCVNTVVTTSLQPTGDSMAQGGDMAFRDDIAPKNGAATQRIRDVYIPPGDYPVAKVGDSVRVCLLSVPKKTAEAGGGGCDPAVDGRGRTFLVYDKTNGAAGVYQNGEHGCGGA